MSAVLLVRKGWSVRQTARYVGVSPGTISKWVQRAPRDGREGIPTVSSRPHMSPRALDSAVERAIVEERQKTGRCGQVIHHLVQERGVKVSLSSVHRVLDRNGLTKKWSPWKRRHTLLPRPDVILPGDLVELDTIHLSRTEPLYVYALIDLASRWAFAWVSTRINVWKSLWFVSQARSLAPFSFQLLQSDHGPEFSKHFSERVEIPHRHIHVRSPNENGHVERFNRTIQDECLRRLPATLRGYQKAIPEYLRYYNTERPHMGIDYLTPLEKVKELFPRS